MSNGVKKPNKDWVNESGFILKVEKARAAIPHDVATTWLDLKARGCLPDWAIRQMNEEMVNLAAL